jgi:hypothetical protein
VPPEERDHRGPDRDVEDGVEDLGRAAREERQQPDLNGVGRDRDDSRGEDPALRFLHARTLGSGNGAGQTVRPNGRASSLAFPPGRKQNPGSFEQLNERNYLEGGVYA